MAEIGAELRSLTTPQDEAGAKDSKSLSSARTSGYQIPPETVAPDTIDPKKQSLDPGSVSPSHVIDAAEPKDHTPARGDLEKDQAPSQAHVHMLPSPEPHGIYMRPLQLMISCYSFGVIAGIGHHLFYSHFDGSVVASVIEQERNLRIGNFFALAVKLLLSAPVWFSFTQWLWRTLKHKAMSVKALDTAFGAETSVLAFFDAELLKSAELPKLNVGVLLILLAWCLQVLQLITPATLTVVQTDDTFNIQAMVPSLDIANASQSSRFAYYKQTNSTDPDANPNSFTFQGPRTILTRLSTATASSGEILTIQAPAHRSSYSLQFPGPFVRCTPANSTVVDIVETFLQNSLPQGYFAFVPSYDTGDQSDDSIDFNGTAVTALGQPRLQETPRNATNEVWMKFWRYLTDGNGDFVLNSNCSKIAQPVYSVCGLWNVTYAVDFIFDNGIQTIKKLSVDLIDAVDYPNDDPSQPSNLAQHSYTAFFSVLSDQLVGSIGLVANNVSNATTNSTYSSIDTQIEHTSLVGSNDLDYVFDLNEEAQGLPASNISLPRALSDQRLQDKALAQNQTLPFLVEQLSFNATMSLMNDALLAPSLLVTTAQTTPVNRYQYNVRNLWLAYGLADFFVLVAIFIGMLAIHRNRASHKNSFSAILSISRDPQLAPLFPECCHGAQPLPRNTMRTKLVIEEMQDGGESFKPNGHTRSVCDVCERQRRRRASSRPELNPRRRTR